MKCEVWSLKSNANETDKEVTFVYAYGPWLKRLKVSVGRKTVKSLFNITMLTALVRYIAYITILLDRDFLCVFIFV